MRATSTPHPPPQNEISGIRRRLLPLVITTTPIIWKNVGQQTHPTPERKENQTNCCLSHWTRRIGGKNLQQLHNCYDCTNVTQFLCQSVSAANGLGLDDFCPQLVAAKKQDGLTTQVSPSFCFHSVLISIAAHLGSKLVGREMTFALGWFLPSS